MCCIVCSTSILNIKGRGSSLCTHLVQDLRILLTPLPAQNKNGGCNSKLLTIPVQYWMYDIYMVEYVLQCIALIDWLAVLLHRVGSIGHIHGENCLFFSQSAPSHTTSIHNQFVPIDTYQITILDSKMSHYFSRHSPAALKNAKMFSCFTLVKTSCQ